MKLCRYNFRISPIENYIYTMFESLDFHRHYYHGYYHRYVNGWIKIFLFFFIVFEQESLINFPNTGPFSSLKCADELDISFFSRGGMSWHLYTPVGPLKNHPTGAFYSSNGSSRHQSLKDKCASSLALTPGICRRFFLHHPPRRFIILSKFHHFILRDARFLGSFSLLLPTLGTKFILVDRRSREPVAKLLSTSRSNVQEHMQRKETNVENEGRFQSKSNPSINYQSIDPLWKLHEQEKWSRTNCIGTKNRKIRFI